MRNLLSITLLSSLIASSVFANPTLEKNGCINHIKDPEYYEKEYRSLFLSNCAIEDQDIATY